MRAPQALFIEHCRRSSTACDGGELQLTLSAENADGSRNEPSGRGFFPGKFNGADVTVKDSTRYAATGGWGYYNFNHHEPKAPTAKVKDKNECAYCHMASAKSLTQKFVARVRCA
jgi:Cytochrome P460